MGNSMMVWNFPCRAAGPSPTSMYLFSGETGEASWECVRACASSRDSNLVDGEHTSKDLGRDKVVWPTNAHFREALIRNVSLNSWYQKLRIRWCRKLFLSVPVLSRIRVLSLGLKRTSTWLRMNSTTTDWMRTSMKADVPLKQADSICFDLQWPGTVKHSV